MKGARRFTYGRFTYGIGADVGGALAFAKYCHKEWPSENVDRVFASIVRNRGLD